MFVFCHKSDESKQGVEYAPIIPKTNQLEDILIKEDIKIIQDLGILIDDDEESMLDQAFNVKNESRLGCQIEYIEELDGITLTLAPN